jgi:hypothetical protein
VARTLARPVEQGLAYRVTVRGRNWTGSAVRRASVADDGQRMGSVVADPRGFQEFGEVAGAAAGSRASVAKETAMIESSRKHGPFDSRYPRRHSRLTFLPASSRRATSEEVADRLDWQAFSTRFFAGHDHHDLQVLEAYEAYRDGSRAFEFYRDGSAAYEARRREAGLVSAALHAWEDEGGGARVGAQAPTRAGTA